MLNVGGIATFLTPAVAAMPISADALTTSAVDLFVDQAGPDLFPSHPSSSSTSVFTPKTLWMAQVGRALERPSGQGDPGGLSGPGGGGRNGRSEGLPQFHLSRLHFDPGKPSSFDALFDRKLLEVACQRLGGVITDVVVVVGHPLVVSRRLKNYLDVLGQSDDPLERFAKLAAQTQGSKGKVVDIASWIPSQGGLPVVRLSPVKIGSGRYSKQTYIFYQKEGPPVIITYKPSEAGGQTRRRIFVTDPALRESLWDLERQMDRLNRRELQTLIETLYREGGTKNHSEAFLTFFQSYVLLLEAQETSRYPAGFFDALWRLIYQVRLSKPRRQGQISETVRTSYQTVRRYLGGAAVSG